MPYGFNSPSSPPKMWPPIEEGNIRPVIQQTPEQQVQLNRALIMNDAKACKPMLIELLKTLTLMETTDPANISASVASLETQMRTLNEKMSGIFDHKEYL